MSNLDLKKFDRNMKVWLLVVSLMTLGGLILSALAENYFVEWRHLRSEYASILRERAENERELTIAGQFVVAQVEQTVVPQLGVTDRCITCHTGVQDPRMADLQQPFTTHPGGLLSDHPPEEFGCTVCHRGQGLATATEAAHGFEESWLYPMYGSSFLYSPCSKCHDPDSVYAVPEPGEGAPLHGPMLVAKGKALLDEKGCLGCHVLDTLGGTLGPDITLVGAKTRHEFDFTHFDKHAERSVVHWLMTHFLEPAEVSPGTLMPDLNLSELEAEALTAYVLTLHKPDVPHTYIVPRSKELPALLPATGAELYAKLCSSCHGGDGRASEVPGLRTPALNNVDMLAVASDDYLRFIISNGRSRTAMPAWGPESETLTYAEIDKIVAHIRGWEHEGAALDEVRSGAGDPDMGRAYYRGLCVNCHGDQGQGDIGNALNSPAFLGIVSDQFLAQTIIEGRPGTAMASWKHLPAQAVSDLLAYLRSWQNTPPTFEEVKRSMAAYSKMENVRVGEILYRGNCATCHGQNGEGGIGLTLNSADVLPAFDDEYLYRTITEGRPTTSMPAWRDLSADQLAAIIVYLRSWHDGARLELEPASPRGNFELGKIHFDLACAQCHGDEGQGGVGPQLANPVLLSTASDEMLQHWISRGRIGTAMRGFLAEEQGLVELTASQIGDVIAYLRRLGMDAGPNVLRTGVGNAKVGRELFVGNCAGCHGANGEGASGPQLHNRNFLAAASDGFLAATIVLGREGTPMRSMIHGQEGLGQIAPEQVQDVIAFMRSWDVPASWQPVRSVAEMSARAIASGRVNFGRFCAGCHGPNGYGEEDGPGYFAPALNNPEFLQAASDGFLQATIARGRSRTPMRPFGKGAGGIATLEGGEISDIVSYIRSWEQDYLPEGD
ncbi:MAG: c-type cytochrome [Candidatus Hydrogenedentes bacterium]|nr:c-type cytochrome [Candidatus Hydrogenedentota bacterium]